MNKKRILFISASVTKKEQFDGERIKSTYVLDGFKKIANVTNINLSTHKLFKTIYFFVQILFFHKRYALIVISKDPHGATYLHKLLAIAHTPTSKVCYFEIGPNLYKGILDKKINKQLFIHDKYIVVETNTMKKELESVGFSNVSVFPNFKKIFDVPLFLPKYPKEVLSLIFFSRIDKEKGIFDLIDVIKSLNKRKVMFNLDIFGRPQNSENMKLLGELCKENSFINYCGVMNVNNEENYIKLSKYDLHVFPTHYTEGFPGTLIDFFIAGVPTLSSDFNSARDILFEDDSFIYKMNSNDDMKEKLQYIYNNQSLLLSKRKNTFKKKEFFSVEQFDKFIETTFGEIL